GGAGEDVLEDAFVLGIEMLDQHEGNSGVNGEMLEQLGEGFNAASRSAEGDDREVLAPGWFGRRCGCGLRSGFRLCFRFLFQVTFSPSLVARYRIVARLSNVSR